jgi:membrane protein YdbS with pleckstrin-like domain
MRRVDVESQLGPRPQWWALYVIALVLVALVWILEVSVQTEYRVRSWKSSSSYQRSRS